MAHSKHSLRCLEIVNGVPTCMATGKPVVRRGPKLTPGYADEYDGGGYGSGADWERVSLSYADDWNTVMIGEKECKGAKHMGIVRLSYKGGSPADRFDVWQAKSGKFYARQIP